MTLELQLLHELLTALDLKKEETDDEVHCVTEVEVAEVAESPDESDEDLHPCSNTIITNSRLNRTIFNTIIFSISSKRYILE